MLGENFIYGLPCLSLIFLNVVVLCMFVLLLRGCIIADFFFRGKRVVGGNVRPCWGCCLVCGFVGRTLARRVLSGAGASSGAGF